MLQTWARSVCKLLGEMGQFLAQINNDIDQTDAHQVSLRCSDTCNHQIGGAMAKTAAERQAAYRAWRDKAGVDGNGQRRVSMWLSTEAALALARLAFRYGVKRRALVENMMIVEDECILATMKIDTPEWDRYFA